jgi:hypothetical protein
MKISRLIFYQMVQLSKEQILEFLAELAAPVSPEK